MKKPIEKKTINNSIKIINLIFIFCLACTPQKKNQYQINKGIDIIEIDILNLKSGYKNGDFTIKEITEIYLDRINHLDFQGPELKSIIQINPDAIKIASKLDQELNSGNIRGPLHGIPVVLKDNIDTDDKMNTTAGSTILKNSKPNRDSYVAKKLRDAGAVIIAKANLSEWANFRGQKSSSGWSGINGQTKNPYVLTRNPCGSSSGSGVAVSANLTVLAIGTETNGSIVCPSSANGIVGIKPTVGLISRSGIIPISFTQDTPGPMARTLSDAVIALGTLTGVDLHDTKTLNSEGKALKDYTPFLNINGLKEKRIGLYTESFGINHEVDSLVMRSVRVIEEMGATVIKIDRISPPETAQNSFQVMLYEYKEGLNKYFSSLGEDAPVKNLEELIKLNVQDSFELKYFNQAYLKMAQEKSGLDSEEYLNALSSLKKMSQKLGIDRIMNEYNLDAIIAATGSPAWTTDLINGDNYNISSSSPAAWAGYPNISVPMGNIHGLPVGLSFFGRAWSEPTLIEICYGFEQATKSRIIPTYRTNDESLIQNFP
tara:strand:- start:4205 stop:5836 length:1632 start_codon:yes stop_codon:yes gene_type:complete